MSRGVGDNGGAKAGFEFGKSLPIFVHFGVARIIDTTKVKNITAIAFGRLHGSPGEEGRGEGVVTTGGSKGGIVGSNTIMIED